MPRELHRESGDPPLLSPSLQLTAEHPRRSQHRRLWRRTGVTPHHCLVAKPPLSPLGHNVQAHQRQRLQANGGKVSVGRWLQGRQPRRQCQRWETARMEAHITKARPKRHRSKKTIAMMMTKTFLFHFMRQERMSLRADLAGVFCIFAGVWESGRVESRIVSVYINSSVREGSPLAMREIYQ